jgi:hypothetical protein
MPTLGDAMNNNLYIRRGTIDTFPAPWKAENVEMSVMYLKANRTKLCELCDRTLNNPSNGHFKFQPTTDYVMLTFQSINQLWSMDKDYQSVGFIDELEASFWIFVKDENNPDGEEMMHIPYMFTDNPLAVLTGREVYGFPKEFAEIKIGDSEMPYSVKALAATKTSVNSAADGVPSTRIEQREIIRVEKKNFSDVLSWETFSSKAAAIGEIITLDSDVINLFKDLINLLQTGSLRYVLLKQFRGIESRQILDNKEVADFQSICFAEQNIFNFRNPEFILNCHQLIIPRNLLTHSIVDDLGLSNQVVKDDQFIIDILLTTRITLSFILQSGKKSTHICAQ